MGLLRKNPLGRFRRPPPRMQAPRVTQPSANPVGDAFALITDEENAAPMALPPHVRALVAGGNISSREVIQRIQMYFADQPELHALAEAACRCADRLGRLAPALRGHRSELYKRLDNRFGSEMMDTTRSVYEGMVGDLATPGRYVDQGNKTNELLDAADKHYQTLVPNA